MTKLVQNLEAHLRTKLPQRTTRRVTVTADGAAYYERVVRLWNELEDLRSDALTRGAFCFTADGNGAARREAFR